MVVMFHSRSPFLLSLIVRYDRTAVPISSLAAAYDLGVLGARSAPLPHLTR